MSSNGTDSWWDLHVRAARGESLSAEERSRYQAGLQDRERAERMDLASLRAQREVVSRLESEQELLQKRRADLDAEIAALELALNESTRRLLGV